MRNFSKTFYLLLYFIGSLFFMETVLQIATVGELFTYVALIKFLFLVSFAALFSTICSLFRKKTSYMISIVLLAISAFIISTQLVYYSFFRTYYNLYSAGNASQISDFWQDIIIVIFQNLHWITALFIPVIILVLWGKKIFVFGKPQYHFVVLLILIIICSHFTGVAAVYAAVTKGILPMIYTLKIVILYSQLRILAS